MVVIPASLIAKQGAKQAKAVSTQYLGFDFIPLLTSLALFYIISFTIAKFMEASIYASGAIRAISNVLGYKIPKSEELPQGIVSLFVTKTTREDLTYQPANTNPETFEGKFNPPNWDKPYDYGSIEHQEIDPESFPQKSFKSNIKFWDIVNIVAILIIVVTAFNFQKSTEATGAKVQPITWVIFGLIVGFITLTGISKLVMKYSKNNFQRENR